MQFIKLWFKFKLFNGLISSCIKDINRFDQKNNIIKNVSFSKSLIDSNNLAKFVLAHSFMNQFRWNLFLDIFLLKIISELKKDKENKSDRDIERYREKKEERKKDIERDKECEMEGEIYIKILKKKTMTERD